MKTFRVEHKDWTKPPIKVTLWQPPYEDVNILNKTGWEVKDVKIIEIIQETENDND
tara:strand:+ start:236 stop:403 length:168 start_codon:yes stop_codon:yes gene_type:complete